MCVAIARKVTRGEFTAARMSTELQYYDQDDPATVLGLTQKASSMLSKSSLKPKSQLLSVVSAVEEPTEWAEFEQVFLACLRSGDDESAHLCLERLTARFGAENHRVMALRGMYQEAQAKDEEELHRILRGYNAILREEPMNIPINKRRNALIRHLGMNTEALDCLQTFIQSFPSDTESWCELADLYLNQGMFSQAIFCIEEALLIVPNAWNLHARLGELNYLASQSGQEAVAANEKYLTEAIRRFSRSIELCQDFLRGYYGLKLATEKLAAMPTSKGPDALEPEIVQRLNETATSKLKAIIKEQTAGSSGPRKAELIAAQALLDESKR